MAESFGERNLGLAVQGEQQDSSSRQQQLDIGPGLRLRLDSLDADSGRSVKALVTADASLNGPRLQKVLTCRHTTTLCCAHETHQEWLHKTEAKYTYMLVH